jgi:hypothetical protein
MIKSDKMMKFLIQKCSKQVRHDFAFTLLEAVHFNDWLLDREKIITRFINTEFDREKRVFTKFDFKPQHKNYVPVGSIEFVTEFIKHFYGYPVKPINIPQELLDIKFTKRFVFNGTEKEIVGEKFVKSNDQIKAYTEIVTDNVDVPEGNYQISEVIDIDSEWRAFVYGGKLVGLKNYSGSFTYFPDIHAISDMIGRYEHSDSVPIAYTLDVGVNTLDGTFIIEVHDFFSCGLYGFADLNLLPRMLYNWFQEYLFNNM